jgi:hypothetical protein
LICRGDTRRTRDKRCQLTVALCALIGFIAMMGDLEDLPSVTAAYQRYRTNLVERSGGLIAKDMGDCVLSCCCHPGRMRMTPSARSTSVKPVSNLPTNGSPNIAATSSRAKISDLAFAIRRTGTSPTIKCKDAI